MADRHKNRTRDDVAKLMEASRDKAFSIDDKLRIARTKIDWPRRNAAEKSFAAWLKEYGIGVFIDDEPSPHLYEVVNAIEAAGNDSRPVQILIARGHGKTSFAEAYMAYCFCTGKRKLGVVSSINANQAQQILKDVTRIFPDSKFAQDYPDIALPIALLDGHGRRSQRQGGHDTKVRMVTDTVQFPTITTDAEGKVPSAASGACIKAKALKSVRGTKNGTQRPDVAVLDDLQTREIAENPERVADVLSLIRGDVMGLAGKQKLAVIMLATTIAADDVTEQLREDKAWRTIEFKAIIKWPDEWLKEGHGLWGEYFALFDDENANDRKHTRRGGSLDFYKKHRAEMDAGADILNWDNYDKRGGQVSGLQKLLEKYHEMGHKAFMAEYQMEPQRIDALFEITPKLVLSRVRPGTVRGDTIDGCVFTAAATDINPSYALSTAICRFDLARSCFVSSYFVQRCNVDSKVNDTAYNRKIYELLVQHVNAVKGLGISVNAYGIDCGGKQWEPVTRLAAASPSVLGLQVTPMAGRAGRSWNPNVKTRVRDALNDTVFCRDAQGRVWLAFNADAYREQMQRAWGAETGAAGGCTLYDGGIVHTEFAIQLSNERLIAKQKLLDGRIDFHWKTKEPHDFGDCLSMCYALAGSRGISGGSSIVATAAPVNLVGVNASHAVETDDGIAIGCDF